MEEQQHQIITAIELKERTGRGYHAILSAIKSGELPATRYKEAARVPYQIHEEAAREFCERMGWPYSVVEKPPKPPTEYITATELGKRAGRKDHKVITTAIKSGELPAWRKVDKSTFPYHIREEDARVFCERMGWTYSVEETQSATHPKNQLNGHSLAIDPSDRCNACGSVRNVVGHMHKGSREVRGYLCTRCQRIVDEAQEDIDRLEKVAAYLRRTHVIDKAASIML